MTLILFNNFLYFFILNVTVSAPGSRRHLLVLEIFLSYFLFISNPLPSFVFFPGILLDMASIFEENYLCHTSQDLLSEQFHNTDGVFVLNENKLSFNKVLVGRTAKTRLKFSNNSKVPCVINLFIKYNPIKVGRGAKSQMSFHCLNIKQPSSN